MIGFIKRKISWLYWNWVIDKGDGKFAYDQNNSSTPKIKYIGGRIVVGKKESFKRGVEIFNNALGTRKRCNTLRIEA